ncbi:MAG: hypothetical protein Q8N16_01695 [bacterium]|nr:hypothetical protein [bacterium]
METLKKIARFCILTALPCWAVVFTVGIFFPDHANDWWNGACAIVGALTALIGAGIHLSICLFWLFAGTAVFLVEAHCLYLYIRQLFSRSEFEWKEFERKIKEEWYQIDIMSFAISDL